MSASWVGSDGISRCSGGGAVGSARRASTAMSSFAGWTASIDSTKPLAQLVRVAGVLRRRQAQRLEPLVDRHAALLHEPVGVEHDRRPGRELHGRLDVVRAVEHAERRVVRALQVVGVALRVDHERRHVARVGEPHRPVVGLHDEVEQRRHLAAVEAAHQLGEPVEHAGRRVALDRVRAHRMPQLAHQRGGADAVADHVAHRHAHAAACRAGSRRTSRRPRPRHRACTRPRPGCP